MLGAVEVHWGTVAAVIAAAGVLAGGLRILVRSERWRRWRKSRQGQAWAKVSHDVWETYQTRVDQLKEETTDLRIDRDECRAQLAEVRGQVATLTALMGDKALTAVQQLVEEVHGYHETVKAAIGGKT